MRRNQYQREVLSRLARIDSNLDKISRGLAEMIKQKERGTPRPSPAATPSHQGEGLEQGDKWSQEGIANIMGYQAGKKQEGDK